MLINSNITPRYSLEKATEIATQHYEKLIGKDCFPIGDGIRCKIVDVRAELAPMSNHLIATISVDVDKGRNIEDEYKRGENWVVQVIMNLESTEN